MKALMEKLERLLKLGGIKKDAALLVVSGAAVICSLLQLRPFFFDMAWVAVILCDVPIILEAVIGLVTAFDIKADVLVSLALVASLCIGEIFAAGEVAFIMQLGALLEELTVAKARAGIERLVHLTPRTARVLVITNSAFLLKWRKKAWPSRSLAWRSGSSFWGRACTISPRRRRTRRREGSTCGSARPAARWLRYAPYCWPYKRTERPKRNAPQARSPAGRLYEGERRKRAEPQPRSTSTANRPPAPPE